MEHEETSDCSFCPCPAQGLPRATDPPGHESPRGGGSGGSGCLSRLGAALSQNGLNPACFRGGKVRAAHARLCLRPESLRGWDPRMEILGLGRDSFHCPTVLQGHCQGWDSSCCTQGLPRAPHSEAIPAHHETKGKIPKETGIGWRIPAGSGWLVPPSQKKTGKTPSSMEKLGKLLPPMEKLGKLPPTELLQATGEAALMITTIMIMRVIIINNNNE